MSNTSKNQIPPIILASSSTTRQQLLDRFHLPYLSIAPEIDESPHPHETADQLALRLSQEKANKISQLYPQAIVIGSDQVAWRKDEPHLLLGKPLNQQNAIQQLKQHSGQTLIFSTGLSVQQQSTGFERTIIEHFQVTFRHLSDAEIVRYIEQDSPLYCAGSFKCESLGISLFEQMSGQDFTSLMGLPLMALAKILRQLNLNVP